MHGLCIACVRFKGTRLWHVVCGMWCVLSEYLLLVCWTHASQAMGDQEHTAEGGRPSAMYCLTISCLCVARMHRRLWGTRSTRLREAGQRVGQRCLMYAVLCLLHGVTHCWCLWQLRSQHCYRTQLTQTHTTTAQVSSHPHGHMQTHTHTHTHQQHKVKSTSYRMLFSCTSLLLACCMCAVAMQVRTSRAARNGGSAHLVAPWAVSCPQVQQQGVRQASRHQQGPLQTKP